MSTLVSTRSVLSPFRPSIRNLFRSFPQTHVTVAESKTSRKYGDFFLRHGLKFNDVYTSLKNKPLPIPKHRAIANVVAPVPVVNGAATAEKDSSFMWGAVKA